MRKQVQQIIQGLQALGAQQALWDEVQVVVDRVVQAFRRGNKLLICGNGGSAADAQHMAGEFLCRFYHDRQPLPAMALTTDTSTLTAIGNDYDFAQIFSRQVQALGQPGDLLFGISTSGNSKNVYEAFAVARQRQIPTVLLTGQQPGTIATVSDHILVMPARETPRIQEMMLIVEHLFCEAVERTMIESPEIQAMGV